jgi:hypothetical protein
MEGEALDLLPDCIAVEGQVERQGAVPPAGSAMNVRRFN